MLLNPESECCGMMRDTTVKACRAKLPLDLLTILGIVILSERSESKDLFAKMNHKSNLKCEDPSTPLRYAAFRSG